MVSRHEARLGVLVAANLLASAAHFADNALRFHRYPEPHWISGPSVVIGLWLAITPLLLAGWALARRQRLRLAALALELYAVLSLFVLGHYAYQPATPLTLSIHTGILVNALAALALLLSAPVLLHGMRTATVWRR